MESGFHLSFLEVMFSMENCPYEVSNYYNEKKSSTNNNELSSRDVVMHL